MADLFCFISYDIDNFLFHKFKIVYLPTQAYSDYKGILTFLQKSV